MGYVVLIRPINCLIASASVLIGAWIGQSIVFSPALLLACLIAFIVCAFGNIVNDLSDIDIDRVNNPQRPLVAGTVSKPVVIAVALVFAVLALLSALSLGLFPFLLVGIAVSLLLLYGVRLKKTLAANFLVAFVSGLTFILGGLIVTNTTCIVPFVFALFIHLPREIIKDVTDLKGDAAAGVNSLPIRFGTERSYAVSALFIGMLLILLPFPFFLRVLKLRYMLIVLLCAYPLLLYTFVRLLKRPGENELPLLSTALKVTMGIGLVSMIP
jgi:geranylgeranylglycerol-phosphate geranylgeranyltransferase